MTSRFPLCLAALGLLAACQARDSQHQYDYSEVGKSRVSEFGTVIRAREVDIRGENTGTGALAGATAGGVGGYQFGNGQGQMGATLGGAVIGALAGAAIEQAVSDRKGIEYTVVKENGKTVTSVQNLEKGDRIFKAGERVMVQMTGSYQRILPAGDLPTEMNRPKGITFKD